jgi:hypothetical protein
MWRLFVLVLIAQGLVNHAAGAEQNLTTAPEIPLLPRPDPDGFVTLFNGHDLNGWTGLADFWSVKDGSISGRQTENKSRQTFLILSAIRVTDFELHFRYRFASPEGNSGLQFRSVILDPRSYRVGGYQADFDAKATFDGSIYDEAGAAGNRGTLSNRGEKTIWDAENKKHVEPLDHGNTDLRSLIKIGEWNDVVLVVKGNHVVYSVNDHVMTDLIDGSPAALNEGVLALQLHQGFTMDVRFKDLRIKLLHP